MTSTLDEGASACALARYLAGDAEPPKRGAFPFAPLALLVTARYGRRIPHLRTAAALGEDVRVVGLYWSLKLALNGYADAARSGDRHEAEHTLAMQAAAAFDETLRYIRDTSAFIDCDLQLDFADSVSQVLAVRDELRLLAGVLALCLWECGHEGARAYVREQMPDLLNGPDGHTFVQAALGLSTVDDALPWRSGQGARGALRLTLARGQTLLDGAARGGPARPRPVPAADSEPAWATEAREKATRDKAATEALAAGPSLLVLASVDHLPGSAKDGAERPGGMTGSTVRAEWAPFAGRRWPLVRVPDLAAAREVLVAEFPYAEAVIDAVLRDLAGRPHVYIRPILLVGAPGCGKTRLARRIAEVLGLGFQNVSLSGMSDSALTGTSRQWSTYRASTPLQLLKRLSMACAVVIADEIDKTATGKHNGSVLDGLLPFLTPDACRIVDPALECPVDLSAVSWIATANSLDGLRRDAPALLDRFRVYTVPTPGPEHMPALLKGVMAELRAERGQDEHWCPDLTPDEAELVAQHYRGGSVRGLRRLCEAVLAGREALATRM